MKFLYLTDIHIKFNNLIEVNELIKCVQQQQTTLSCTTNDVVDYCVVAGDTLDTHEKINTHLLNKAYELIDALRHIAPVYIIVGNHDYINNQQYCSDKHWLNALKEWSDVVVVDKPTFIGKHRRFLAVPYVFNGRFVDCLDEYVVTWRSDVKCIFAHQEFRGAKMGYVVSQNGDVWDNDDVFVISGHIHDTQHVGKNIYYPGSTLTHSYVDRNNSGGVRVFTFSDDDDYRLVDEKVIKIENVHRKTLKRIAAKDAIEDVKRVKTDSTSRRIKIYGSKDDINRCKRLFVNNDGSNIKYDVVLEDDDDISCDDKTVSTKSFDEILIGLIDGNEDLLNDLNKLKEYADIY